MSGVPPVYSPEIPDPPKFNDSRLMMFAMTRGSMVFDREMACRLAETYLVAHYGIEELEKQLPLIATDAGDCWRVEGSWNRDCKRWDTTWFFITLWKYDGRVVDLGVYAHPPVNAEAVKLLREGKIGAEEFVEFAAKDWPKRDDQS